MAATIQRIDRHTIDNVLAYDALNVSVHNDYQGRGMRDTCFGVGGDHAEMAWFWMALAVLDPKLGRLLAAVVRIDTLGNKPLYYFPGFVLG